MSVPRRLAPAGVRGEEGFTLAEMLVALTGGGLLIGLLVGLLASQSRFHLRNEDAIQASQIARALSDGMGAEIRGAGPGDLLLATPDTVSVRVDVLKAVVCGTASGGSVDLFAYDSTAANLQSGWRGTALSGPYQTAWVYADGFTPASSVSTAAETACRAAGADRANRVSARWFRRTSGWSGGFAAMPAPGSLARVYGRLTYAIHPSDSASGTVSIRRNGQEFVPLESGAAFEYRLSSGAIQARVASGDLSRVREVRLIGAAVGRNGRAAGRRVVYALSLRN